MIKKRTYKVCLQYNGMTPFLPLSLGFSPTTRYLLFKTSGHESWGEIPGRLL